MAAVPTWAFRRFMASLDISKRRQWRLHPSALGVYLISNGAFGLGRHPGLRPIPERRGEKEAQV
jgi:hypothetical protein